MTHLLTFWVSQFYIRKIGLLDTSHELLHHGHGNNKSRKQNQGGHTKQQQHPPSLVNLGNDDDSD